MSMRSDDINGICLDDSDLSLLEKHISKCKNQNHKAIQLKTRRPFESQKGKIKSSLEFVYLGDSKYILIDEVAYLETVLFRREDLFNAHPIVIGNEPWFVLDILNKGEFTRTTSFLPDGLDFISGEYARIGKTVLIDMPEKLKGKEPALTTDKHRTYVLINDAFCKEIMANDKMCKLLNMERLLIIRDPKIRKDALGCVFFSEK